MVERTASHFRGASICLLASTATVAMDGFARRHTVDQSDGICNTCSPVAMDLWRRKPTLSSGYALRLSRFTAINPCQLGYNYYIERVLYSTAHIVGII